MRVVISNSGVGNGTVDSSGTGVEGAGVDCDSSASAAASTVALIKSCKAFA